MYNVYLLARVLGRRCVADFQIPRGIFTKFEMCISGVKVLPPKGCMRAPRSAGKVWKWVIGYARLGHNFESSILKVMGY